MFQCDVYSVCYIKFFHNGISYGITILHMIYRSSPFYYQKCSVECHRKLRVLSNKFECPFCSRKYQMEGTYKRHFISHFDSRHFACEICNQVIILDCFRKNQDVNVTLLLFWFKSSKFWSNIALNSDFSKFKTKGPKGRLGRGTVFVAVWHFEEKIEKSKNLLKKTEFTIFHFKPTIQISHYEQFIPFFIKKEKKTSSLWDQRKINKRNLSCFGEHTVTLVNIF